MRYVLAIVAALAFSGAALADRWVTVQIPDQAGTYSVLLTVGADGSVTGQQVPLVRLGPGPGPEPPVPVDLTARGIKIRDLAKAVSDPNRDKTALQLAAFYREMANRVTKGEIKDANTLAAACKIGADMLATNTAAWKPVRGGFSDLWSAVAQEGGNVGDYAKLLGEVAAGLEASVSGQQAIDMAFILMLIQLIMEILKLFPKATLSALLAAGVVA